MNSKMVKLFVASLAALILVVAASVECSEGIVAEIEDLVEKMEEVEEDYKTEMDEVFWEHLKTAEKMMEESAGNDSYALMELSRSMATIESISYALERNAMLSQLKVLEQNIAYFNENVELAPLMVLRIRMRFIRDTLAAIQRPMASLYKLIKYYVAKHKSDPESVPEEVKLAIEDVFRLFDSHQDYTLETYNLYISLVNSLAAQAEVDVADIKNFAQSHDHMVDAVTDCKDCSTNGRVYNQEYNIRSMFSSQEELEAFVSKAMDEKLAKKMEEIEQTVEGHLSVDLDTNVTVDTTDLFKLYVECIRESIIRID